MDQIATDVFQDQFCMVIAAAVYQGNVAPLRSLLSRGLPKAMAVVDRSDGKAVVFETDGRQLLLSSDKHEPRNAANVHLGMLFQFGEIIACEAGPAPYEELRKFQEVCQKFSRAGSMFIILLQPDTPVELRNEAANALEEILQDQQIEQSVRTGCLENCPPPDANLDNAGIIGKVGELLAAMAAKWRAGEPPVASPVAQAEG